MRFQPFAASIAALFLVASLAACDSTTKAKTEQAVQKSKLAVPQRGAKSDRVCATKKERGALNSRALQTEMMVGALSCKQNAKYANAVKKFKGTMKDNGETMKGYFNRAYGSKQGTKQMDQYVTKLANEAATRSKHTNPSQYCNAVNDLFDEVLVMSENQYAQYADDPIFANAANTELCH